MQPDIFDTKRDLLTVLEAIGAPVTSLQTWTDAPAHWRPGRTGVLKLGNKAVAYFGEIHPRTLKTIGVEAPESSGPYGLPAPTLTLFSADRKKNSLSWMIGPPTVTPPVQLRVNAAYFSSFSFLPIMSSFWKT